MGRHSARPDNRRRLSADSEPAPRRAARGSSASGRTPASAPLSGSRRPAGRGENFDFDHTVAGPRARRRGALESAPAGLRAELDRKKQRRRRIVLGSLIGAAAVIVAVAVGGFFYLRNMQQNMQQNIDTGEKLELELAKADPQEPYNLLIMGYDRRPGEKQYRSDTMLLARIDPIQQKVWLISLPRDYRVQIPGEGNAKLNAAYSLGQEQLTIETVEKLTGQKVNHYMGVTFDAFAATVDAIGGVEIDVPTKINDRKADYTKKKTASVVDAGLQTLDGAHALTFVRSRDYPTGDFQRMENQQAFFRALADQVAGKVSIAELPTMVAKVVPHLKTDMSLMDLLRTARDLKGAGSKNIYTATLPGKWVSPFIVPDEEGKADILAKFEAGEPFVDPEVDEEAAEAAVTDPAKVTVTVWNGTTKAGVAKQAAAILKARGFTVSEVGNANNQTVHDLTTLVYKEDKSALALTAKYLQPTVKQVLNKGMYDYETEILLIIGDDWDLTKLPVVEVRTQ